MTFRVPTGPRVTYLACCMRCGKTTEYLVDLEAHEMTFHCDTCVPFMKVKAVRYARRFKPRKKHDDAE